LRNARAFAALALLFSGVIRYWNTVEDTFCDYALYEPCNRFRSGLAWDQEEGDKLYLAEVGATCPCPRMSDVDVGALHS
jgi:hypothetical protein